MKKVFAPPFAAPLSLLLSLLDWMQGDGRRAGLFLSLGSAGTLLTAYFFQYVIGLLPCYLCYLERKPHMALIGLGLVTALTKSAKLRAGLLGLMAVLALSNAGVSLFHVGVEHHWWEGLRTCASPAAITTTMEEARDLIFSTKTIVPCDKAAWIFLGISMAGWNGILCLMMAGWASFGAHRSWRLTKA